MLHKPTKALLYGVLIWLAGFVWGSIVFMVPFLKHLPSMPVISMYPAISFPLIPAFWYLATLFGKRYLADAEDRRAEGLKLGIAFSVINIILDYIVLVVSLNAGPHFYSYVTIWAAYFILFLAPFRVGRTPQGATAA